MTVGEYTLLLYPFIEGENGFTRSLSPYQWRTIGQTLAQTHAMQLPQEMVAAIPRETFDLHYCQRLAAFLARRHQIPAYDSATARMLALVDEEIGQLEQMLARTTTLAAQLSSQTLDFVLCHTDIHAGNVLVETANATSGALYVVDWDAPLYAPKERDLMFVGAGIAGTWYLPEEEIWFYEGYGPTAINPVALAYYRYARIVEDIALFCDELGAPPAHVTATADETPFLPEAAKAGAADTGDREQLYRYLCSSFLPNNTLEMAHRAYATL